MNKLIRLHVYAAVAAGLALSRPPQLTFKLHHLEIPGRPPPLRPGVTGSDARGDRNDHRDYDSIGLASLLGLGLMRKSARAGTTDPPRY